MTKRASDFVRYLEAKRTVDDRALSKRVQQGLLRSLPAAAVALEIGAGSGTMIERLHQLGLLHDMRYLALDVQSANIAAAVHRLRAHGMCEAEGAWRSVADRLVVEVEAIDLFEFLAREQRASSPRQWDLLIAHAFLDLVDLPTTLPPLLSLARPGGLLYFTLNFDGETTFRPCIDTRLDARIEEAYHHTMDTRVVGGRPSGDSRCGRHLVERLREHGVEILDTDRSDWQVVAGPDGYHADEAYFLHFILDTVEDALHGHAAVDPDEVAGWLAQRHAQVERRELEFRARHVDVLGRMPEFRAVVVGGT